MSNYNVMVLEQQTRVSRKKSAPQAIWQNIRVAQYELTTGARCTLRTVLDRNTKTKRWFPTLSPHSGFGLPSRVNHFSSARLIKHIRRLTSQKSPVEFLVTP